MNTVVLVLLYVWMSLMSKFFIICSVLNFTSVIFLIFAFLISTLCDACLGAIAVAYYDDWKKKKTKFLSAVLGLLLLFTSRAASFPVSAVQPSKNEAASISSPAVTSVTISEPEPASPEFGKIVAGFGL